MNKKDRERQKRAQEKRQMRQPLPHTKARPDPVTISVDTSPLYIYVEDEEAAELLVRIHQYGLDHPGRPWMRLTDEVDAQIRRNSELSKCLAAVLEGTGSLPWDQAVCSPWSSLKRVGVRVEYDFYNWLAEQRPCSVTHPREVSWKRVGKRIVVLDALATVGARDITNLAHAAGWDKGDLYIATRGILADFKSDEALVSLLHELRQQPEQPFADDDSRSMKVLPSGFKEPIWAIRHPWPNQASEVTLMYRSDY